VKVEVSDDIFSYTDVRQMRALELQCTPMIVRHSSWVNPSFAIVAGLVISPAFFNICVGRDLGLAGSVCRGAVALQGLVAGGVKG
jgi:hypothetical protein